MHENLQFSEGIEAENWLKMSYKNDGWFKVIDFELCAIHVTKN